MLNMNDRENRLEEVFDNRHDRRVFKLSAHLRAKDFDEVFAMTGESPHLEVMESWHMSSRRWVILNKYGSVVAAMGVRALTQFSDIGIPWLLGTDSLDKITKSFLKMTKQVIEEIKKGYSFLVNNVDARYNEAVRWMYWLGFVVEISRPLGFLGLPFRRCYMECE